MSSLTADQVKSWFTTDSVIQHYYEATIEIGLWASEELVFQRVFDVSETLLEVGCGTGRISLGLWELGYQRIMGTDFSRPMITEARRIAAKLGYSVPLRVADARDLSGYDERIFDGVIFGFNGLMQIPGRSDRRRALEEIHRVLRPGGRFVFTTHDREVGSPPGLWEEERQRWEEGAQDARLHDFGDRIVESDHGETFIHIPSREEIREDLAATQWTLLEDAMRSNITRESEAVETFAVDCRFWVVEKPTHSG